ncbi:MAG: transglutaminase-like domain-containing protein [Chloroflexi bacterium]|nr:transglutaminase-like domain-containing protein [Chloroflexota bacterium]MCI0577474.1 transglutaminase-like domain-containing protein [Chloroflexota bacterium]MCI0647665.1 transglutaminase-like domain-containing protein [Chloroflexota bacterium]MCI0730095.1 transglutaminase-like domain-containing protein [Chloroflexota bacterium]
MARSVAYPDLDINHYLARLDQLAAEAQEMVSPADPAAIQAELLADFLFQQYDFRGNVTSYDDPRNSFLNEVLDRRLGIPITLSVVYIAVAERLGLAAYGISMPGHFIVGVRDGDRPYLFDPFHRGGRLSQADCARLIQQTTGYEGPFRQDWLEPAAPRDILVRMLNNLRLIYVQRAAWNEALSVIQHLRLAQPHVPEHLRDIGLVHYQTGSLSRALQWLEAYLRQAPNGPDASTIREGLRPALENWVRLN